MCDKIQRLGFGCTNIGVTGRQTPSGLIRFILIARRHSKRFSSRVMRHRTLHRQLSRQSLPTVDKVPPSFPVWSYATCFPINFASCWRFALAPHRLRNRAGDGWSPLPRDGLSPARSVCGAGESFARETKYLRHGRRSLLNGGGLFGRYSGKTDAEGEFHHLLERGTQALWI